MSLSRLSFVRQITAQVQGRSSMESRVSTQSEISSNDAVVEIERLKADNQLQVEISALEAEAQEIELMGGGIEELEGATEEVSELQAAVESRLETGGLTKGEAEFVQLQLNAIEKRTGLMASVPSVESFSGSSQDRIDMTVASLEGVGEWLSNAWNAIVEFFKNIFNKIKGWFSNSKKTSEKNEKDSKENESEASKQESNGETEKEISESKVSKMAKDLAGKASEKTNVPKDPIKVINDHYSIVSLTVTFVKTITESIKSIKNGFNTMIDDLNKPDNHIGNKDDIETAKKAFIDNFNGNVKPFLDSFSKNGKIETINGDSVYFSPIVLGGNQMTITYNPHDGSYSYNENGSKADKDTLKKIEEHFDKTTSMNIGIKSIGETAAELAKLSQHQRELIDGSSKVMDDVLAALENAKKNMKDSGTRAAIDAKKAAFDACRKVITTFNSSIFTGGFSTWYASTLPSLVAKVNKHHKDILASSKSNDTAKQSGPKGKLPG